MIHYFHRFGKWSEPATRVANEIIPDRTFYWQLYQTKIEISEQTRTCKLCGFVQTRKISQVIIKQDRVPEWFESCS